MSEQNIDHVAICQERYWGWRFVLGSDPRDIRDVAMEVADISKELFECSDGYIRPLRINLAENIQPEDRSLEEMFAASPRDRIGTRQHDLSASEGVALPHLLALIEADAEHQRYVGSLSIEHVSVKFRLATGDEWVDRENYSAMYSAGVERDFEPHHDPIQIKIHHGEDTSDHSSKDYVFYLEVKLRSSIWFEDTEIGRINADRLVAFLSCLEDHLEPELIQRLPRGKENEVRNLF